MGIKMLQCRRGQVVSPVLRGVSRKPYVKFLGVQVVKLAVFTFKVLKRHLGIDFDNYSRFHTYLKRREDRRRIKDLSADKL